MKKKIVFVVNYFPYTPGGAELQSLQIASSFKDEYEVHFIVVAADVTNLTRVYDNGYIIWKLPKRKILRRILGRDQFMNYFLFDKIFESVKPDYVYQRCAGFHTWIVSLLKDKYNYRLSFHFASDADVVKPTEKGLRGLIHKIEYFLVKKSLTKIDQVFAQNSYQKELCAKNFHREDVLQVYNFSFPVREIYKKPINRINVLWIANIKPIKQPELFLDIATRFQYLSNVHFIMIGSKGDKETMEKIDAAQNSLENFSYLGYQTNDEINKRLEDSHILINTSVKEGFSNTFVQSWFRGCPVLSLNSNPDNLFNEHKLGVCADGDYDRLIDSIKEFIEDSQIRNDYSFSSMEFANEFLSVDKILPIIKQAILYGKGFNNK